MANWFPPLSWDSLHPIVIHFPIALLLVAPVFIFLGLVRPERHRLFSVSALILIVLGTVGAWVAVSTGEAAAQLADQTPPIGPAIHEHEEFAEWTRLIFTILAVVYGGLVAAPLVFKRLKPRLLSVLGGVFLVIYFGSCLVLARTGHLGGRLVHTYGVHAMMGEAETGPAAPPEGAPSEAPAPEH
jgi:uncharacterized membrane protein